jgi:hypothetical protein
MGLNAEPRGMRVMMFVCQSRTSRMYTHGALVPHTKQPRPLSHEMTWFCIQSSHTYQGPAVEDPADRGFSMVGSKDRMYTSGLCVPPHAIHTIDLVLHTNRPASGR